MVGLIETDADAREREKKTFFEVADLSPSRFSLLAPRFLLLSSGRGDQ
jgi:hypothetical protein